MKITEEMVDYVSALARLKLADEERSAMAAELEHILEYMEMLGGLDTHDIAPHKPPSGPLWSDPSRTAHRPHGVHSRHTYPQ